MLTRAIIGLIAINDCYKGLYMKNTSHFPIPVIKALRKIGSDISGARRRRRIPIKLMAERAGLSRSTIAKIERGDPSSSIGGYASVLFVLGLTNRLSDLVDFAHDLTGFQLEEENLPKRIRLPRAKKVGENNE